MNNIREVVISCIRDISPEAANTEIKDDSDPELDLCLNSLMGVELASEFKTRLGIEIEISDNPLVCTDPTTGSRRLRNIGEIVSYLSTLQKGGIQ